MPCLNNQTANTANATNNGTTNTKEIIVGNTLFNCTLREVSDCAFDLICTPCNIPTSVYCVARITERQNCCNDMEYYQAFINTDPVQIIQDCNLEQTVIRAIEAYFDNIPSLDTNSSQCCNRNFFGLF